MCENNAQNVFEKRSLKKRKVFLSFISLDNVEPPASSSDHVDTGETGDERMRTAQRVQLVGGALATW